MRQSYNSEPNYWAIVPAAGVGQRMQVDTPKQYLKIHDKFIIEHTLERLLAFPALKKIIVPLSKNDLYAEQVTALQHDKVRLVAGGKERYQSVMNGLTVLAPLAAEHDWVIVHDAVRPCLRQADLDRLVKCLQHHTVGGLLGVPAKDTMKRTGDDDSVIETVARQTLWHALTPQMFRFGLLTQAIAEAIHNGVSITDEAGAMEYAGHKALMVAGHGDNIKVTLPFDLTLAAAYMEQQARCCIHKVA